MDATTVRWLRWGGVILVLALVAGGAYAVFTWSNRYLHGTGCSVAPPAKGQDAVPLDLEQAANAATIAAVAHGRKLPEQALVIAYATALQESKIRNLPGGDRDSIGLFQQRPSQGWGTPAEVHDPVHATGAFFAALVKVKKYQKLPVEVAAQEVQRSADGGAYAQHVPDAQVLAAGFSGREPAAVRCWWSPDRQTTERLAAIGPLLTKSFGKAVDVTSDGRTTRVAVAGDQAYGWSVASWAVSYAQGYGLKEVRYAGRHWTADDGFSGWTKDRTASSDEVTIR